MVSTAAYVMPELRGSAESDILTLCSSILMKHTVWFEGVFNFPSNLYHPYYHKLANSLSITQFPVYKIVYCLKIEFCRENAAVKLKYSLFQI